MAQESVASTCLSIKVILGEFLIVCGCGGAYFLKKATYSQRKFGSDRNGNPNYGREAVKFF